MPEHWSFYLEQKVRFTLSDILSGDVSRMVANLVMVSPPLLLFLPSETAFYKINRVPQGGSCDRGNIYITSHCSLACLPVIAHYSGVV